MMFGSLDYNKGTTCDSGNMSLRPCALPGLKLSSTIPLPIVRPAEAHAIAFWYGNNIPMLALIFCFWIPYHLGEL